MTVGAEGINDEREQNISRFMTDMDEMALQRVNPTPEYQIIRNIVENLLAVTVYPVEEL